MRDCVLSSLRGGRISRRLMWRHRQQDRSAHGWTADVPNVKVSSVRQRLPSAGDQKPLELSAQNSSQSFSFFPPQHNNRERFCVVSLGAQTVRRSSAMVTVRHPAG